jgi:ketosteroid isomerase-like protein
MTTTEETRSIVDAYYRAGVAGRLPSFASYLDEQFSVTAPNYLPWGGTHEGADYFREQVLEHLAETLDFSRFRYESFTAEGSHAVALINIGITGTDDSVKISEHWEVNNGKAMSIWVAYFEPQPLLKLLGITVSGN